jgi:tRNA-2-methylthio-N6-dimethylallyladenosine synthase
MKETVDEETKTRRLMEVIEVQRNISDEINKTLIGKEEIILLESKSKKSGEQLMGRTDGNKSVIIPKGKFRIGETISVKISNANSASLFAEPIIS